MRFRIWAGDDLELALALWGDPEVTTFIGGPFDTTWVAERLRREIAFQEAHSVQYWPLFLSAGGDFVGCCGLKPKRPDEGVYELGFHLWPAHWGHGYAAESARVVIDFAFTTLRANALFAGHHPANDRSRRLLSPDADRGAAAQPNVISRYRSSPMAVLDGHSRRATCSAEEQRTAARGAR